MTDEAGEAGEEGEAADGAAPIASAAGPRRHGWLAPAAVGLVVALVLGAAIAFGLVQRGEVDDLEAERDDARSARQVSAAFGEAYLSYDFDDVDASGERVLALATDRFAEDFRSTRAPGIEELFSNIRTTTRATTTDVFLGDVGNGRARALVVVDVDAESDATGLQTLNDLTFVLELVEVGDAWRVDAVSPAPTPDVTGATTTSTTAPG